MIPPLTHTEMSSVMGYMSIACWVIVYSMSAPVWENYMLKSGDGLSVPFILLWLGGDITNLIGGAMAGVLPTMIILAVYYNICDIILLFQVYYYRSLRKRPENQPLLEAPPRTLKPLLPAYLSYPLMIAFVIVSGFVSWALADHSGGDKHPEDGPAGGVELEWKSQLLGYASCFLYIGSRVPQIFHNLKTRCEGLSLAMFFFSISGNVTYVASILLTSMERKYLITNASWIAGAALTIFLDLYVLAQFAYFSYQDSHKHKVFADDVSEEEA